MKAGTVSVAAVAERHAAATWPLAITHRSRGNAGSPDWVRNCRAYLKKWSD